MMDGRNVLLTSSTHHQYAYWCAPMARNPALKSCQRTGTCSLSLWLVPRHWFGETSTTTRREAQKWEYRQCVNCWLIIILSRSPVSVRRWGLKRRNQREFIYRNQKMIDTRHKFVFIFWCHNRHFFGYLFAMCCCAGSDLRSIIMKNYLQIARV